MSGYGLGRISPICSPTDSAEIRHVVSGQRNRRGHVHTTGSGRGISGTPGAVLIVVVAAVQEAIVVVEITIAIANRSSFIVIIAAACLGLVGHSKFSL